MHPNTPLYEQDFYAWTQEQGALLRDRKTKALDYVNLAEEVESLGKATARPGESPGKARVASPQVALSACKASPGPELAAHQP